MKVNMYTNDVIRCRLGNNVSTLIILISLMLVLMMFLFGVILNAVSSIKLTRATRTATINHGEIILNCAYNEIIS